MFPPQSWQFGGSINKQNIVVVYSLSLSLHTHTYIMMPEQSIKRFISLVEI